MGRTSIDGLTVRSARSSKPSGTAAPRPRTKTTVHTRRTTDITRPAATRKRKVTADEDFLSPVDQKQMIMISLMRVMTIGRNCLMNLATKGQMIVMIWV